MKAFADVLIALPIVVGAYAYAGYPAILWFVAHHWRRFSEGADAQEPLEWPMVSIVVPAYNEERQIRGAIEALLAQDYPAERRQILVISDASTDGTDDIVREYASRGVELLRMPSRSGKTAAENASCAHLCGDIIVNTDASIRFHPSTVRELVRHMADPTVGVASGRDVSVAPKAAKSNVAEAGYVGYEMWLRSLETMTGGIVGASGSGYAIRAELHKIPIRDDLSRDFSAALTARLHGLRAVSVDTALCTVPRTTSLRREYRRKVRTISRGIETMLFDRRLLNPMHHGLFTWKLISHKIVRWLVPVAAIVGVLGLAMLAPSRLSARVALILVALTAALFVTGWFWPRQCSMPRIVSLGAFGVAANLAVIHAIWRVVRGGHQDHIWEPTRRPVEQASTGLP